MRKILIIFRVPIMLSVLVLRIKLSSEPHHTVVCVSAHGANNYFNKSYTQTIYLRVPLEPASKTFHKQRALSRVTKSRLEPEHGWSTLERPRNHWWGHVTALPTLPMTFPVTPQFV